MWFSVKVNRRSAGSAKAALAVARPRTIINQACPRIALTSDRGRSLDGNGWSVAQMNRFLQHPLPWAVVAALPALALLLPTADGEAPIPEPRVEKLEHKAYVEKTSGAYKDESGETAK